MTLFGHFVDDFTPACKGIVSTLTVYTRINNSIEIWLVFINNIICFTFK